LKCDSTGDSGVVVWKRNGIDLGDIEDNYIKVQFWLLDYNQCVHADIADSLQGNAGNENTNVHEA
jgi:hypothetical protein